MEKCKNCGSNLIYIFNQMTICPKCDYETKNTVITANKGMCVGNKYDIIDFERERGNYGITNGGKYTYICFYPNGINNKEEYSKYKFLLWESGGRDNQGIISNKKDILFYFTIKEGKAILDAMINNSRLHDINVYLSMVSGACFTINHHDKKCKFFCEDVKIEIPSGCDQQNFINFLENKLS